MCNDDHGLRQRHDHQNGNIQEDVIEIIRSQKRRRAQCDHKHKNQDKNTDARFTKTNQGIQKIRGGQAVRLVLNFACYITLPEVTACVAAEMIFS